MNIQIHRVPRVQALKKGQTQGHETMTKEEASTGNGVSVYAGSLPRKGGFHVCPSRAQLQREDAPSLEYFRVGNRLGKLDSELHVKIG